MGTDARVVGEYRVRHALGAGGMGRLFLVEDSFATTRVMKMLLPQYYGLPEVRRQFSDEARYGGRATHPNLVSVVADHSAADEPYFVMEWVDGDNLEARMAEAPRQGWREHVNLVVQVSRGLDFLTSRLGLVHRDICPANILVPRDGGPVRLCDLGVATTVGETRTAIAPGRAAYMAPEQARGAEARPSADVFSLGVVLFELLTGQRFYGTADRISVLGKMMDGWEPAFEPVDSGCPTELAATVRRAVARDVDQRFPDVGAFRVALDSYSQ